MPLSRVLPGLVGLALVALLALLRLADPAPVAVLRDMGFDFYQHLAPRPGNDSAVRVVDIDERALQQFGQWPWPRDLFGRLTDRLTELGAAAIGYDVLFAEPDRMGAAHDTAFAAALGRANAALGFSVVPDGAALTLAPLPELAAAASGLGGLSLSAAEAAGTVRRVPLLWSDGTRLYPGLGLETLRLALGVSTLVALGDVSDAGTLDGVRVGGFSVPTTAAGELVLYDRPVPAGLVISAAEVLGDGYAALGEAFDGRIVLVGTSASGLLDLHATPLSPRRAGVLIHAGVIDQIVTGAYLSRADWLEGLEILGFVVAGALLVGVVLQLGPLAGLLVAAGLIAALVGASWGAFALRGWLVDASFPAAGALLVYGAMVYVRFARTERRRQELRRAFGHYVAPALLARIERSAGHLALGGEARELSVMFADMRGFTAFTEAQGPDATLRLLNTLFGALGHEIVSREGTIDKFIGDAIMAFWNAPLDVADHAGQAVAAALAMRARLAALNADGTLDGVAIGIGLATGPALVGHMGLHSRFDYSAIGDSVNVASRVEAESKRLGFDIVAAEATRQAAPAFAWLAAGEVTLRGKAAPLGLHLLVGDAALAATPGFQALRAAHEALLAGTGTAAACAALARTVEPRLLGFYARAEELASPA